jgi:uridine kinase
MSKPLISQVLFELKNLITLDSQQEVPVVQSVSLNFWEQVKAWVHHIALTPEPFTIALTGGSGSGKSMVREVLVEALSEASQVSAFTQDNYYRNFEADFPHWPIEAFYHRIDFDDPAHIQFKQLIADLKRLKTLTYGQTLHIPQLIYGTPTTKPTSIPGGLAIPVTPFVVTEGIHSFFSQELRSLYDLRIFVDVDEKARRARWLARNQKENRGITDNMWQTTVDCMQTHILPKRPNADLIINNVAPLEHVTQFIHQVIHLLGNVAERAA